CDLCPRPVPKRLSFAYGRAQAISRTLLVAGLTAALAVSVALSPSPPGLTVWLIGVIIAAYALLFVVSPLLTEHWMTRSRLVLRQGWYFRAVIPFSDIESIARSEEASRTRVPLGIHRPPGPPALFVTGGRTNPLERDTRLLGDRLGFHLQLNSQEDSVQVGVRDPQLAFVGLAGPKARGGRLLDDLWRDPEMHGHLPDLSLVQVADREEVCPGIAELRRVSGQDLALVPGPHDD